MSALLPRRTSASSPDEELVRRAALGIALRLVVVCTILAVGGAAVVFGYLWWRAAHPHGPEVEPHHFTVALDPLDLGIAAALGLGFAIVCTGLAALFFSRRAVQPLADSLRRQRSFVADASHELKTPVAVVSARTQQLQAMVGNDPALKPVVAELRQDTQNLSTIIEDLLSLAVGTDAPSGSCELAAVLESVKTHLEQVHPGKRVAIPSDGVTVTVPSASVERMVTALVDNALGFSPDGATVSVTVTTEGRTVTIRVRDAGSGIVGVDQERIFDRFARGTAAPDIEQPRASHGIGLALVRETARRYGGDAKVERSGRDGTTMALTLPREPDDARA